MDIWDHEGCPGFVERLFLLCPFLGGSSIGGSTISHVHSSSLVSRNYINNYDDPVYYTRVTLKCILSYDDAISKYFGETLAIKYNE